MRRTEEFERFQGHHPATDTIGGVENIRLLLVMAGVTDARAKAWQKQDQARDKAILLQQIGLPTALVLGCNLSAAARRAQRLPTPIAPEYCLIAVFPTV